MEKIKAIWDSIKAPQWFKVAFVVIVLIGIASAVLAETGGVDAINSGQAL